MFVAPSPKNATATRGSSRNLNASAAPTIAAARHRRRRSRPGSRARRRRGASSRRSRASSPRASRRAPPSARSVGSLGQRAVRAVRGGDDVALLQRAADPHGHCLLTDRHGGTRVPPARKRSSTFSSKRRMSSISRKNSRSGWASALPLYLGHGRQCSAHQDRRVSVAEQYRELESRLPAEWADARFVLNVEDASRAERAASMLTAFQPGRVGGQVRFSTSARRQAGAGAAHDGADRPGGDQGRPRARDHVGGAAGAR